MVLGQARKQRLSFLNIKSFIPVVLYLGKFLLETLIDTLILDLPLLSLLALHVHTLISSRAEPGVLR